MSTTPSISEVYTVVGGESLDRENRHKSGLSIVLLNRGSGPFRRDLFDELGKLGVREVISVEQSPCPYDVEPLVKAHPMLRFIIFTHPENVGVKIDTAMRESVSDHVFVLQGDMRIKASAISSRVFSKIAESGRVCTVPSFSDKDGEVLPTVLGPVMPHRGTFDVQPQSPRSGETPTLIPWDYSGIYRKEKHLALGGFDPVIEEPWWQKLDYGMRCWLWGEDIRVHGALKAGYVGEPMPEDTSPGPGYRRFFLKNLAVRMKGDSARLPRSRWMAYVRSSGESASATRTTWIETREWVHRNRYRFAWDATAVTELWEWED